MQLCLVSRLDWMEKPEESLITSTLSPDGSIWCCPDEESMLALANSRFAEHTDHLVALAVDEAGSPECRPRRDPIHRRAVLEIRYLRRDPAGRYSTMERRPALAEALDLLPHPEGGWYRETWASSVEVRPDGYPGSRPTATAIYFLLPPGAESCWHQLRSDEIWLWHRGGPLELKLGGDGDHPGAQAVFILGPDAESGQHLQALVPRGTWQTAHPVGDEEVLVSTVVSPGFDFSDFRTG
jgi:hypothetical protein